MIDRLLEEIDRQRLRLAELFAGTRSVSERFAISQELGRLLEMRRALIVEPRESPSPTV